MSNHYALITNHPHWRAFDEEEAKAHEILEKSHAHTRKSDESRRQWEAAMSAYDAEVTEASLDGRDPDPAIEYPGEWVEPRSLLGRRAPVEVVHERLGAIAEMRRSWAKRMAPELVPTLVREDVAGITRLRSQVDELSAAVREVEQIRESFAWIRSCGGEAPAPTGLYEVQMMRALSDALRRAAVASDVPVTSEFGSVPMNLDSVSIS